MLVSVIIPTFNGENHIVKCVESVISQTYDNKEIIVVDDNGIGSDSQVKTFNLLKDFIDSGLIKYYPLKCNMGGSHARNFGEMQSNGEYLLFLDDDDEISSNKLEAQVFQLNLLNDEYAFSYSSSKICENNSLSNIIKAKKDGTILYDYLMGRIYIGTGTVLLRRKVFEEMKGYDETFSRHQDWEFYTRILNKYKAISNSHCFFIRYICNRNTPKEIEKFEKNMKYFIDFLKNQKLSLPKRKVDKVIRRYNNSIAIKYLKKLDLKNVNRLLKETGFFKSALSFAIYILKTVLFKMRGIKS